VQAQDLPTSPRELKALLPYQFAGEHIGRAFPTGWFHVIAQLCLDIDELLGEDKMDFNWLQIKEKFGVATLYATMREPENDDEQQRQDAIYRAIRAASDKTCSMCIVCGEPSNEVESPMHYVLQLCPAHGALFRAGGIHALPKFWMTSQADAADHG
jgi:hypothetical protein